MQRDAQAPNVAVSGGGDLATEGEAKHTSCYIAACSPPVSRSRVAPSYVSLPAMHVRVQTMTLSPARHDRTAARRPIRHCMRRCCGHELSEPVTPVHRAGRMSGVLPVPNALAPMGAAPAPSISLWVGARSVLHVSGRPEPEIPAPSYRIKVAGCSSRALPCYVWWQSLRPSFSSTKHFSPDGRAWSIDRAGGSQAAPLDEASWARALLRPD